MKTVLITGVNSGFGKSLTKAFLDQGYFVLGTMRNLEQRKKNFIQHERLKLRELDVTNPEQRHDLIEYLKEDYERLDILINNAGFALYGALEDMSEEQIRYQMEVNFLAPTFLIKSCLPFLKKSKDPKIFNITSIAAVVSMPLSSLYSASKFALEGLSQGLLFELEEKGVSLCTVCPGGHRTNFLNSVQWPKNKDTTLYQNDYIFLENLMKKLSQGNGTSTDTFTRKILTLAQKKKIPKRVVIGKDAQTMNFIKSILTHNFFYRAFIKLYTLIKKKRLP